MARKTRKALRKNRRASRRQRGGNPKIIAKHIGEFDSSESHPGCYFVANEENISKDNKVLIIGPRYPKQTDSDLQYAKYPYEECLFFFDMSFPKDYPGSSPSMKFVNSAFYGDNFRYHPNLYQVFSEPQYNGKVCLSILGTWPGPGWTSDMNIESVLTTIQSLLGPNPIHNEPGNEARLQTDPIVIAYNHKVCHRSIKFTIDTYKRVFEDEDALPPNIEPFVDELKARAFTAMKFFARKLAQLKSKTPAGTQFVQELHHPATRIDYDSLLTEVLAFIPMIPEEYAKNLTAENTSVKSENDARKAEQAAALAARMAAMGINGSVNIKKYALAQEIKEKEEIIKAMRASGDNVRNLERNLQKLKNRRAALNSGAASSASAPSTGAAASAPKKNKNNNNAGNPENNTEYQYENENDYEYDEEE